MRLDGLSTSIPTSPSKLGGQAQPPTTRQEAPPTALPRDSFESARASSLFGSSSAVGTGNPNPLPGQQGQQTAEPTAPEQGATSAGNWVNPDDARDARIGDLAQEAIQSFALGGFAVGAFALSPLALMLGGMSFIPGFDRELGALLHNLYADEIFTIPGQAAEGVFTIAQDLLKGDSSSLENTAEKVAEVPVAVAEGVADAAVGAANTAVGIATDVGKGVVDTIGDLF